MTEVTEDVALKTYRNNMKNNCYSFLYPETSNISFNIVLNDTSTFLEQIELEDDVTKEQKSPVVLYVVLNEQIIQSSKEWEWVKNPPKFFIFDTFEQLVQHISQEKKKDTN